MRKNLLLTFASVLLTYLLVEIVYSLAGISIYRRGEASGFQWVVFDPIGGWVNRPRYSHGDTFRIDSKGFREVPRPPGEAVRTLVCMGDSGTFGIWDDGAWPQFPDFPSRLQNLLPSDRVINAGVIGYTSSHIIRQYKTRIRHLRPQIVILRVGFNDHSMVWDARGEIREPASALGRTLVYSLSRTFAVQTALTLQRVSGSTKEFETRWNDVSSFKENLEKLARYVSDDGAQLILVDYPIRPTSFPGRVDQKRFPVKLWGVRDYIELSALHRPYAEAILETGQRLSLPTVKTAPRLEEPAQAAFSSTDIVHPTARGYDVIAEMVAAMVRSL
ncbi:MAG: SGNH/GDSL hydrolase family protein [Leptospirales bacterium]|nr:SGNH/GDSL hydrolase family protein [Leptospirales bacterium]